MLTLPSRTLSCWSRACNFVQFYAPPAWLWARFTTSPGTFTEVRQGLVTLASIIAFLTVVTALVRRRRRWIYVAAELLLPCLPYILTSPLLWYRYLVSTPLILVAVAGTWQLLQWILQRQRKGFT